MIIPASHKTVLLSFLTWLALHQHFIPGFVKAQRKTLNKLPTTTFYTRAAPVGTMLRWHEQQKKKTEINKLQNKTRLGQVDREENKKKVVTKLNENASFNYDVLTARVS